MKAEDRKRPLTPALPVWRGEGEVPTGFMVPVHAKDRKEAPHEPAGQPQVFGSARTCPRFVSTRHVASRKAATSRRTPLVTGLQFDDVVGRGFALASGADADVPGFLLKLGEIGRAEITHAALNAPDELGQHPVH